MKLKIHNVAVIIKAMIVCPSKSREESIRRFMLGKYKIKVR